jgi:hypothetical protein
VDDSSVGWKTFDEECVVLHIIVNEYRRTFSCPCGCDEFPAGKKTTFMMGHDARLRGVLIRAHLTDTKIRYIVNNTVGDPMDAYDAAAAHFWTSYLDAAVERRDGKNREVARRALEAGDRLLKVARWSVTGQVIAIYKAKKEGMHWIEWVDQAGNIKTINVRADESPLGDISQEQVSG